jgi:hypothetical protein
VKPGCRVEVIHHVVCRHQVEVEVWPPRVELYFFDERCFGKEREVDLIDTQVRFEATVINSDRGVNWQVYDAAGGPGAGSIDATGLYQAPAKGGLTSGHTDVVVATSVEDPLRKAYAWITLIGEGPLVAPQPSIEIWPKQVNLYYQSGMDNAYIDDSNKMQLFQATVRHSANQTVDWQVNPPPPPATPAGQLQPVQQPFVYVAPPLGTVTQQVIIRAHIPSSGNPGVYDDAQVILLNYYWPGLH